MQQFCQIIDAGAYPVYQTGTLIIGSGCAGLNAADTLYDCGSREMLLITEGVNMGTSRNTGSDKQTFYKLSLAADEPDSVAEMAKTIFDCGGIHGDTAMVEASCSVRSFLKLAGYGVPFPTNAYGAYIGYKTDHDPRRRATSAGPYTSKYMTECLERAIRTKGISILDHMTAVRLLVRGGRCYGAIAVDGTRTSQENRGLTFFLAENTILATGGPAGVYDASVYPESQTGMTGMAVEAGAALQNLMDWQYGLSSVAFRWNVSGTYQQVLPRYLSVDPEGREREFLLDYYKRPEDALNMVFLKGYQWPFDVRKLSGSSWIDVLVHRETGKGNRIFLDFTRDPAGLPAGFPALSQECLSYLTRSNAVVPTPIARLAEMNAPAIGLYRKHGIDLRKEPLEIRVCAQHCCGGIAVDANWQTSIPHLYAVGEAAGTFGPYRPGGTALASTQTGSMRAAEHIAYGRKAPVCAAMLEGDGEARQFIRDTLRLLQPSTGVSWDLRRRDAQKEFSRYAAQIRDTDRMERMLQDRLRQLLGFRESAAAGRPEDLPALLRSRDILLTQGAILSAMLLSAREMGSRGSGLVLEAGKADRYLPASDAFGGQCVYTRYENGAYHSVLEPVRPLPHCEDWFETTWKAFREKRGLSD